MIFRLNPIVLATYRPRKFGTTHSLLAPPLFNPHTPTHDHGYRAAAKMTENA